MKGKAGKEWVGEEITEMKEVQNVELHGISRKAEGLSEEQA